MSEISLIIRDSILLLAVLYFGVTYSVMILWFIIERHRVNYNVFEAIIKGTELYFSATIAGLGVITEKIKNAL